MMGTTSLLASLMDVTCYAETATSHDVMSRDLMGDAAVKVARERVRID